LPLAIDQVVSTKRDGLNCIMTSMKFSLMREIADEADARLAAQEITREQI